MRVGRLGQMLTHRSRNRLVPGARFAIDNGVVRMVDGVPVTDPAWNESGWLAFLDQHAGVDGCCFAAVPDEVGDGAATLDRWATYAQPVRDRGYRPAFVLQNGCAEIPADAAAVFVGGVPDATGAEWKESAAAGELVRVAKARGMWAHMGRVNTRRRLRIAAEWGCDSVDGTLLAFGPDYHLPRLLGWLDPDAPSLFGVA